MGMQLGPGDRELVNQYIRNKYRLGPTEAAQQEEMPSGDLETMHGAAPTPPSPPSFNQAAYDIMGSANTQRLAADMGAAANTISNAILQQGKPDNSAFENFAKRADARVGNFAKVEESARSQELSDPNSRISTIARGYAKKSGMEVPDGVSARQLYEMGVKPFGSPAQQAIHIIEKIGDDGKIHKYGVTAQNPEGIDLGVSGSQAKLDDAKAGRAVGAGLARERMEQNKANTEESRAVRASEKETSNTKDLISFREGHQVTKRTNEIEASYGNIEDAGKRKDAAGDISLVYSYMKMMDPGSTVREGEFATAQNAGSVPERVRAAYNKALNGERMDDAVRQQFVGMAKTIRDRQRETQQKLDAGIKGEASKRGVDPGRVVIDPWAANQPTDERRTIGGHEYIKVQGGWKRAGS